MGWDGNTRREILVLGALGVNWALTGCLRAGDGRRAADNPRTPTSRSPRGADDSSSSSTDEPGPSTSDDPTTDAPAERPSGDLLDVETASHETTGRVLDGGIGPEPGDRPHATLIATGAGTDRFEMDALDEETVAFVEETAFPREVLLVVQRHLPSITLDLELAWARIDEGVLDARVETGGEYVLDASTNATLLARLHLDGRPVPDGGTATVVDRQGRTTAVDIE